MKANLSSGGRFNHDVDKGADTPCSAFISEPSRTGMGSPGRQAARVRKNTHCLSGNAYRSAGDIRFGRRGAAGFFVPR